MQSDAESTSSSLKLQKKITKKVVKPLNATPVVAVAQEPVKVPEVKIPEPVQEEDDDDITVSPEEEEEVDADTDTDAKQAVASTDKPKRKRRSRDEIEAEKKLKAAKKAERDAKKAQKEAEAAAKQATKPTKAPKQKEPPASTEAEHDDAAAPAKRVRTEGPSNSKIATEWLGKIEFNTRKRRVCCIDTEDTINHLKNTFKDKTGFTSAMVLTAIYKYNYDNHIAYSDEFVYLQIAEQFYQHIGMATPEAFGDRLDKRHKYLNAFNNV